MVAMDHISNVDAMSQGISGDGIDPEIVQFRPQKG